VANKQVSIYKNVKVGGKWRYARPAENNGKIVPDLVLIDDRPEPHPEGSYYISYYERSQKRFKRAGKKPIDALRAKDDMEFRLQGRKRGLDIPLEDDAKLTVNAAIHTYLQEMKLTRRDRTYVQMESTLNEFADQAKRLYLQDIEKLDLFRYADWVLKRGRSKRTAQNKFLRVHSWLKYHGIRLVAGKDAPKFTTSEPEIYEHDELEKFFHQALKENILSNFQKCHYVLFCTLLYGGLREKELKYLTVGQLNFKDNTLTVAPNPKFDFDPKDWEERSLPLPNETMLDLFRLVEGNPRDALVFPTRSGRPNEKLLKLCKRIAKSAGLDPARFYLHKFRATFASTLLQRGMNLRDVQYLLGHSDLKSTMRYLAKSKNRDLRKQVEAIWNQPPPVEQQAAPGAAETIAYLLDDPHQRPVINGSPDIEDSE
jgi:integrase/recombinase XerD